MREQERPTALKRHQLLFQVLLQSMLRTNAIENEVKPEQLVDVTREEKEELADITRQEKELKHARASCRRVRDELFEACCSFQRDCRSVPIERLSILSNSLKLLEQRTDLLTEELEKFPVRSATLKSLGYPVEEPIESGG
jgi:hypothetical protein